MPGQMTPIHPVMYARIAGILYLVIIVLGLTGELALRSALMVEGDPVETAKNILAQPSLFRIGFMTDSVMVLCDIALAVLLFELLKPVNKTLALMALLFRLAQSSVLALNLLNYYAAILVLESGYLASFLEPNQLWSLALLFLDLHGHGYDLGLILFGAHCLVLGYLLMQSGYFPRALGYLVMAAGVTYLVGSYTRFVFPAYVATVSPIYLVAIFSEASFCLWLMFKGVNLEPKILS